MYAGMFYWRYFSSPEHFLPQQTTRHRVREEENSNCVVGNWSCSLAGFSLCGQRNWKEREKLDFQMFYGAAVYWKVGEEKLSELCSRMVFWDVKVDWNFEFLWATGVGFPLSKQFLAYQREKTSAQVSPYHWKYSQRSLSHSLCGGLIPHVI